MTVQDDEFYSEVTFFELEDRFLSAELDRNSIDELRAHWQRAIGSEMAAQRVASAILAAVVSVTTEYLLGLIKGWLTKHNTGSVRYFILFKAEEYDPSTPKPPQYLGIGLEKRRERKSRVEKSTKTIVVQRGRPHPEHSMEADPKVCEYLCWDDITYSRERLADYVWVQGVRTTNNVVGEPVWICVGLLKEVPWGPEFETKRIPRRQKLDCHSI